MTPQHDIPRASRVSDALLRVGVEIELTPERDPAYDRLWRWLLADDDTHFVPVDASASEHACGEEAARHDAS
jgi:hypothetical protein